MELALTNRIAPITADLWDILRFEISEIANTEIYLDVQLDVPEEMVAKPPEFDSATGTLQPAKLELRRDTKYAKWALEKDVMDPACGYDRVRERVIADGVGAGAGVCFLDWDPSQGTRGRIFAVTERLEDVLWHSSYRHPHDPGNPFVIRRSRLDIDYAEAMWPDAKGKLKPDSAADEEYRSQAEPLPGETPDVRKVTIYRVYQMFDWSERRLFREPAFGIASLPRDKQYLGCPWCGWDSPPAGDVKLPKTAACPECGAQAHLVTTDGKVEPEAWFTKGKSYSVIAPFCPEAGTLEEPRGWPGDSSFYPLMYFVPNIHPHETRGLSDAEWNSDLQCAIDGALRDGIESQRRNKDVLMLVAAKYTDPSTGEPYPFDGSGDFVASVDSADALNAAKHFKGSGLPTQLSEWFAQLDIRMGKTRGIGQLGIPPEQLKGMQVGTVKRFVESGDVPVDRKIESFRREESILLQCWHDMQRKLFTRADWVGMVGEQGDRAFLALQGEDLPNCRIRVTGRPTVKASDLEHMEKLFGFLSNPTLTPTALEFAAQAANIPQDLVRKILKERSAATQPPATGAPQGSGPPNVAGGGPWTAPVLSAAMNGAAA